MLNITPVPPPGKAPRIKGLSRSPMAHMAMSMLILAVAAGAAFYLIVKRREKSGHMREELQAKKIIEIQARAAAGETAAQLELANAYASGNAGLPPDSARAAHWNRIAAQSGNPEAQFRLARALSEGEGTKPDLNEAFTLLKKSAEQGNIEAQSTLGIYLFRGIGTAPDPVAAHRWLSRAVASGSNPALLALESIRKQMTAEQIAEAEKSPAVEKPAAP